MNPLESNAHLAGAETTGGPRLHGKVLVVTESLGAQLGEDLGRCLPGRCIVTMPSFLAAMGEAAQGGVDAVIAPRQSVLGMEEPAGQRMRQLAPSARLILVGPPAASQEEADRLVRSGFDAVLQSPVSQEELARIVLDGQAAARPRPVTQAGEAAEAASTIGEPASPMPQTPQEVWDDLNLAEAVLHQRSQLRAMAMDLVRQRSGLRDLGWCMEASEVPAGHVAVPVQSHGQPLGLLHAPPAAGAQRILEGWAAWLGRWLALGEQIGQLEQWAMRDELTGVWNRRYFNRFLQRILEQAARDRSQVTLMVFDIDDFKLYNDRYGHAAGDEILRETARLMMSVVREHDVVARIGGDEFAVIFWDATAKRKPDSHHPQSVRQAASRFQQAIFAHRFPKLLNDAPGTLTISGGLASFPWDGRTPQDLLHLADAMAMQSKRQGKNAITFGPGALRLCQKADDACD